MHDLNTVSANRAVSLFGLARVLKEQAARRMEADPGTGGTWPEYDRKLESDVRQLKTRARMYELQAVAARDNGEYLEFDGELGLADIMENQDVYNRYLADHRVRRVSETTLYPAYS
jgi:hypothetical protein